MTQLPTFLPALFEAFGHQSADVRKVMAATWVFIFHSCFTGITKERNRITKERYSYLT